jgi:hypothetical protein
MGAANFACRIQRVGDLREQLSRDTEPIGKEQRQR